MNLTTQPMPPPDGARFRCSVLFAPYGGSDDECAKTGTVRFTTQAQAQIADAEERFFARHKKGQWPRTTGPIVCERHEVLANDLVREYGTLQPDPLA